MQEKTRSLGFWARYLLLQPQFGQVVLQLLYLQSMYVVHSLQVNLFVFSRAFLHTLTRVRYFSRCKFLATVFFVLVGHNSTQSNPARFFANY